MPAANCTSVEYTNNQISECTENGISINCGTSKTSIKNNEINVSGNFGIAIFGATDSVIAGNTVSRISEYGINLRESFAEVRSSNIIIKNNASTGGKAGFSVRNSDGTTVTGNTAIGSSVGSIYVADTCTKTVVKDTSFANDLLIYDSTATIGNNVGEVTKEVKKAADGNWYYYENGVINYYYTGLASNDYGLLRMSRFHLYRFMQIWK